MMPLRHIRSLLHSASKLRHMKTGQIRSLVSVRNSAKKYFLINSLTSGICMFFGDSADQYLFLSNQSEPTDLKFDWRRSGRMFTVGILLGPFYHFYYNFIDQLLPGVNLKSVSLKLLCDQLIISPLIIVFFYYSTGLLEQKSLEDCTDELKNKFVITYFGDCLYWPPVQFINFYFLPPQYRVVYISIATMVYNIFLSHMKHEY